MYKLLIASIFFFSILANADAKPLMTPIAKPYKAHQLELKTSNGQLLNLNKYLGKYVLVNFWAYWCGPCVEEIPYLESLYKDTDRKNFQILAVHAGPFVEQASALVRKDKVTFPILVDEKISVQGWHISALPMSFLVDPNGNVIYKSVGPRKWNATFFHKVMQK